MDFEFIFDYLFEHAWEILLGLEMFCLKIFKKKSPEEIQAKQEKREKKRLEKKQRKLRKAYNSLLEENVVSSDIVVGGD